MSFLKRLAGFFSPPAAHGPHYELEVVCNRCGEVITCSINLNNDLSIVYGATENDSSYFCRKVVIGEQRCFQQIEIELTFDRNRRLMERKIKGGKFSDEKA
jgi:hypothetical protein